MKQIIELLEEIYTPAQIVEMLDKLSTYDVEEYALKHDVCSRCYGELERWEWNEPRDQFWGFPCSERMVGSKCCSCGEIY